MANGATVFYYTYCERKLPARFIKVSTNKDIFTFFHSEPELVLKLFLIFGQSEPHCSYKVVLIKKACILIGVNCKRGLVSPSRERYLPSRLRYISLICKQRFWSLYFCLTIQREPKRTNLGHDVLTLNR